MPVGANAGGTYIAAGNVAPSRFVKVDTVGHPNGGYVIQCVGSDLPVGISCQGTRNPPYEGLDDGYAAISGENLRTYSATEECLLQCGTTTFTAGQYLKPDATGRGVAATADGDMYGALAMENGPGDGVTLVHVRVVFGAWRGA